MDPNPQSRRSCSPEDRGVRSGRAGVLVLAWTLVLALGGCPSGNLDFDGDGTDDTVDCSPRDASIHPGATEVLNDGIDQNCDGIDGDDNDLDGYAGNVAPVDCDDFNTLINPGATEVCSDSFDNDCDGLADALDPDCGGGDDDDAGDDDAGDDDTGDDDAGDDDAGDDDAGDDDAGDDDAGDDDAGDDDAGDDDAGVDDAGDDDAGDDDAGDDDAGDDDAAPTSESDCNDGLDDDGDGAIDCLDADCAADWWCTWPSGWSHTATFAYDANQIAKIGGYTDCTTELVATLATSTVSPCATCDRTYAGATTYVSDTCTAMVGLTPTTVIAFGVDFDVNNPTCVTVYAPNESGIYGDAAGLACDTGSGTFTLSRTDPVIVSATDVGSLETTLSFTPQ
jgi:hypothetical protein